MEKIITKLKKIFHFLIPQLADYYYGFPGKKMIVIGVTGTKGKSTTCRYIASVLEAAGHKVGLMSTVEFQIGDKKWLNDKKMSMLGRGAIQKMLSEMVKAGCKYAVVETSSEGILQFRHLGVHYDIAVFTNLGTEHSERHGGFEKMRADKGKLFETLSTEKNKIINGVKIPKISIINTDDANAEFFQKFPADEKISYRPSDAKIISGNAEGVQFEYLNQIYKLNLAGEFNVANALAALVVGRTQKLSDSQISAGLSTVNRLAGRMEFIEAGQDFKVIVDYAHEPLSLTALFESLRKIVGPNHQVIGIVGSDGGGRDVGKRGKMGEIAGRLCDRVVITDVNCFDEDPMVIAEMLAVGARSAGKVDNKNLFIVVDRRQGIAKAISLAKAGDVVVVTAKGTEQVICVANGQKIPWDDRQVTREILLGNKT